MLHRVLTEEFYRLNAGFFLLIATLAFGFMSGVEHKALAGFFLGSPYLLAIPFGIWLIYSIKIINFNRQQLVRFENQFLFNVVFLPRVKKFLCVSAVIFVQLLPAIGYATFLIMMALVLPGRWNMPIIFGMIAILWFCVTLILLRQLRHPHTTKTIGFLKRFSDVRYSKPIIQFYVEWILRRDPVMICGTKIFCAALIFGVCVLYRSEGYDWRLITMAMTASAIANLLILRQLQNFETYHVSWIRNMPVTRTKRFLWMMSVMVVLFIPEFAVLMKHFPENLSFYWLLVNLLYTISLAALFFGLLYAGAAPLETIGRRSFWIFILLIVLVLFKVPLIAITILTLITGFALYSKNYYLFQPNE